MIESVYKDAAGTVHIVYSGNNDYGYDTLTDDNSGCIKLTENEARELCFMINHVLEKE